ncbi:MAG: TRAP transporter substrate-binding protein [Emergencia sp.]
MKKRLLSVALILALVLSLAACGGSGDGEGSGELTEAVKLSLGHSNNTDHHYQVLAETFGEIVSEKTDGMVTVDIYPAEQLGAGPEMLEACKTGTQDLVLGPDAYLANYDKSFEVLGMPYMFDDWEAVKAFPETEVAKQLEAKAEEQGFVILGWAANGFRQVTANKEINSPDDMKGLKIRVGSSAIMSDLLATLGCNPTSLPMSETYSGLQTGIVDGQENPAANIIGSKFYEVQKYMAVTRHVYTTEPLVMSKAKFDSLPEDVQNILLEAGKEVCATDVETCAAADEEDIKYIEEQGVTVTYPDLEAFKAVLAPMEEKYCSQYGDEWTELYKMLREGK